MGAEHVPPELFTIAPELSAVPPQLVSVAPELFVPRPHLVAPGPTQEQIPPASFSVARAASGARAAM